MLRVKTEVIETGIEESRGWQKCRLVVKVVDDKGGIISEKNYWEGPLGLMRTLETALPALGSEKCQEIHDQTFNKVGSYFSTKFPRMFEDALSEAMAANPCTTTIHKPETQKILAKFNNELTKEES